MSMEADFPAGRQLMADPLAEDRAGILILGYLGSPRALRLVNRGKPVPIVHLELRLGRGGETYLWLLQESPIDRALAVLGSPDLTFSVQDTQLAYSR